MVGAARETPAGEADRVSGQQPVMWPRGKQPNKEAAVVVNVTTGPVISIIAGILILIFPRILNFVVAIYLIIIGIMGLVR